eukprot:366496-Chlamydomonas_euryale.AAC.22
MIGTACVCGEGGGTPTDGWMDGRTHRRTDGRTDGWMDGWMGAGASHPRHRPTCTTATVRASVPSDRSSRSGFRATTSKASPLEARCSSCCTCRQRSRSCATVSFISTVVGTDVNNWLVRCAPASPSSHRANVLTFKGNAGWDGGTQTRAEPNQRRQSKAAPAPLNRGHARGASARTCMCTA